MGLPNKKKHNQNITPENIGKLRRMELLFKTDGNTSFLPKSISLRDIDEAVVNEFKLGKFQLLINDKSVPSFFMTSERWSEFAKTWQIMDDDKNLVMPFITIKRDGKPEYGDYAFIKYRIPFKKKFTYMEVPNFDGKYVNYKIYKVPEPIPVQLNYTIKFFTRYMNDVNKFDTMIMKLFSSRQFYIDIKDRYKPFIIESINDEDLLDDKNGERLYVTSYTMKLSAQIIEEDEFEVIETTKKVNLSLILDESGVEKRNPTSKLYNDYRNR